MLTLGSRLGTGQLSFSSTNKLCKEAFSAQPLTRLKNNTSLPAALLLTALRKSQRALLQTVKTAAGRTAGFHEREERAAKAAAGASQGEGAAAGLREQNRTGQGLLAHGCLLFRGGVTRSFPELSASNCRCLTARWRTKRGAG